MVAGGGNDRIEGDLPASGRSSCRTPHLPACTPSPDSKWNPSTQCLFAVPLEQYACLGEGSLHSSPQSAPEPCDRIEERHGRYLGPSILSAIADPHVTEVYVNPQDGVIRFDTR